MKNLRLTAPPGYGAVVPLSPKAHAGLGLAPNPDQAWCAQVNAVFLNAAEFVKAALHYPLAFSRETRTGEFMPVAVVGLRAKENLFVENGHWRAGSYVPAYVRRHPFCVAEIPGENGVAGKPMVCVQEDRLVRGSAPLFDAEGQPTAQWQPILSLIEAIEGARQQTRVLCRRLDALDLLIPFDALVAPRNGARTRLSGLLRVDERKLEALGARDLRTMMSKGELRCVYAHLVSLENFARLMDLAAARPA